MYFSFYMFSDPFFKFGEKTSCQIDNQLNLLPHTTALLILQKSHNKRYKTYPKKHFENPHSVATHLGKGNLESYQHL